MTILQKPKQIRAFISINIPQYVQQSISKELKLFNTISDAELKTKIKFINPENYHMTIAFLGNTTLDKINKLIIDINASLQKYKNKIKCKITGLSGFPNNENARLLYCKVESEEIIGIAENIRKIVLRQGHNLDFSFKPHITLCRFKDKINLNINEIDIDKIKISFHIESVHLMQSLLSPVGAIYSKIETFNLIE